MTLIKQTKNIAILYLLLTAFLVLGTRTATLLHEVLGHTFIALISGGTVDKIKISMFGGGRVWADLTTNNTLILLIFSLSGIIINLITGAGSLVIAKKCKTLNLHAQLFFTAFAILSILGSLAYLILGIYYEFGDPVTWTEKIPRWYGILWLPLTGVAPVAAYFLSRHYAYVQERIFNSSGFTTRFSYAVFTLGMALITYLMLFLATQQTLASATAPEAAFLREKNRILQQKQDALFSKIQQQHPELSEKEIQELVNKIKIIIKNKDVPKKFPILPLLVGLCLSGGVAAFIKQPESAELFHGGPDIWQALMYSITAFSVVMVLAFIGEYIYIKSP